MSLYLFDLVQKHTCIDIDVWQKTKIKASRAEIKFLKQHKQNVQNTKLHIITNKWFANKGLDLASLIMQFLSYLNFRIKIEM